MVRIVDWENCTVELGVVAAKLKKCKSLGLIYLDLHANSAM
jgi:hypothetical protein